MDKVFASLRERVDEAIGIVYDPTKKARLRSLVDEIRSQARAEKNKLANLRITDNRVRQQSGKETNHNNSTPEELCLNAILLELAFDEIDFPKKKDMSAVLHRIREDTTQTMLECMITKTPRQYEDSF